MERAVARDEGAKPGLNSGGAAVVLRIEVGVSPDIARRSWRSEEGIQRVVRIALAFGLQVMRMEAEPSSAMQPSDCLLSVHVQDRPCSE